MFTWNYHMSFYRIRFIFETSLSVNICCVSGIFFAYMTVISWVFLFLGFQLSWPEPVGSVELTLYNCQRQLRRTHFAQRSKWLLLLKSAVFLSDWFIRTILTNGKMQKCINSVYQTNMLSDTENAFSKSTWSVISLS